MTFGKERVVSFRHDPIPHQAWGGQSTKKSGLGADAKNWFALDHDQQTNFSLFNRGSRPFDGHRIGQNTSTEIKKIRM
jgi:hypothetical protein